MFPLDQHSAKLLVQSYLRKFKQLNYSFVIDDVIVELRHAKFVLYNQANDRWYRAHGDWTSKKNNAKRFDLRSDAEEVKKGLQVLYIHVMPV